MRHRLPRRQLQIASCVGRGLHNRDISNELGITEATVKVYVSRLLDRLGMSSRFELMAWAICYKLTPFCDQSLMVHGRDPLACGQVIGHRPPHVHFDGDMCIEW